MTRPIRLVLVCPIVIHTLVHVAMAQDTKAVLSPELAPLARIVGHWEFTNPGNESGGSIGFALKRPPQGESQQGAVILNVSDNSPAQRAGLKVGDVITEVNGEAIPDSRMLEAKLDKSAPGDDWKMKVRRGGNTSEISLTLVKSPPSLNVTEIASLGYSLVTVDTIRGGPWGSGLWYFEGESKNIIYTSVVGGGLVTTISYRSEDLSKDEYTGAVTMTRPNASGKATAVQHAKWNGADEFSVWTTDLRVNGEPRPPVANPFRRVHRRVK